MVVVKTYRKQPETVSAAQLRARPDAEGHPWLSNAWEIKEWMGLVKGVEIEEVERGSGSTFFIALRFCDRNGEREVAHNMDYVVRCEDGSFCAVSPGEFHRTYSETKEI